MTDRDKCQSILRTLLLVSCKTNWQAQAQCACVYIRELQHTAHCDAFHDFSAVRADHQQLMGKDSMQRIAAMHETEQDERDAEKAVAHCQYRTHR